MEAMRSWTGGGNTPADTVGAIATNLAEHGWKNVTAAEGSVHARFGSRLIFRILGAYLPPGRARFPLRLTAQVTESPAGMAVDAKISSDEGWYLVTLPITTRPFGTLAADVFDALESSTQAPGSR